MNRLLQEVAPLLGGDWEQPAEAATVDVLPSRLAVSDLAVNGFAVVEVVPAGAAAGS